MIPLAAVLLGLQGVAQAIGAWQRWRQAASVSPEAHP
jgi:hypothetical protein